MVMTITYYICQQNLLTINACLFVKGCRLIRRYYTYIQAHTTRDNGEPHPYALMYERSR